MLTYLPIERCNPGPSKIGGKTPGLGTPSLLDSFASTYPLWSNPPTSPGLRVPSTSWQRALHGITAEAVQDSHGMEKAGELQIPNDRWKTSH